MIYLKKFETTSQYNAYTADTANFVTPNVSLIEETHGVAYHPAEPTPPTPAETRVVAKFNVTDTSDPTRIIGQYTDSPFSAIEIDGVAQPSVVNSYTFSTTGEHTVKYTLTDPTSIGDSAFSNCTGLTSIVIPSGVTTIGSNAFYVCSSLTSCTIGNGVTSIGDNAFTKCMSLTSIAIPSGVTSIGMSAFDGCTSLTSIVIPSGVTSIGFDAFYGCTSVSNVYCYPNPANLTWDESGKDDFKEDGSTVCHVYSQYLSAYETKFGDEVNVTFVGDLT